MSGMNIGQISIYSILSTHSPGLKTRTRHSAGNRNVRPGADALLPGIQGHLGPGQLPDDNAELLAIWCVPGEQIETG
jgi:hypothetical protein